jgi:type I restriction enzyme S subunit
MSWEERPLGEVLSPHDDWVNIESEKAYREVTVRLWGKGAELRRECLGAEIGAPTRNRVKSGQFIISKIDARNGAFALVPEFLDGAVVTSDFPAFEVNTDHALPGFVGWMSKTESFVDVCRRASEGSTNRVRLKMELFLNTRIPLPPVEEQRRIVAKLDAAAERIARIEAAQSANGEDFDRVVISLARRPDWSDEDRSRAGWVKLPLSKCLRFAGEATSVDASESYPNLGIYSYARGVFGKPDIVGTATSANQLFKVKAGQFIYSRLFAFEGAYTVVSEEFDGFYVSGEFPSFEINHEVALPEFFLALFRSPDTWAELASHSKGVGNRRQRVQVPTLLGYEAWFPPLNYQRKIAHIWQTGARLRAVQQSRATDLSALMPALLDRAFKGDL